MTYRVLLTAIVVVAVAITPLMVLPLPCRRWGAWRPVHAHLAGG